ncbi:MAG TPA: hypothetical protein EYP69_00305 [Bacteroidales bacterium]|nr:hypothetical protein [Bacteroidales bacterium]
MEHENNNMEIINNEMPKNSNLWMYILLIILALGIIGLSIKLISVKNQMKGLLVEKEVQRTELQKELDSLVLQHQKIKAEYGELSDSLTLKDSIIQANAVEIKKLLNTKWEYYKIKKKLHRLQTISQGYIRQMDSIYTVNHQLTEENQKIKEDIIIEKRKNKQLQQTKEELKDKVEKATALQLFGLKATPIHKKGNGRERATDKIKRVDRVKVCFTIGKNTIVDPGPKTIYIRIARPNKKILVKGRSNEYSFMFKGEKLQYSIKKTIDYKNQAYDQCVYWNRRSTLELKPGVYHVDVFEGNHNIGGTTFTLK